MCGLVSAGSSWDWAQNEGLTLVLRGLKKKIRNDYLADNIQNTAEIFLQAHSRCNPDDFTSHKILLNMPNTSKPYDPCHLIKHLEEKETEADVSAHQIRA